jgi:hypothetical protein
VNVEKVEKVQVRFVAKDRRVVCDHVENVVGSFHPLSTAIGVSTNCTTEIVLSHIESNSSTADMQFKYSVLSTLSGISCSKTK